MRAHYAFNMAKPPFLFFFFFFFFFFVFSITISGDYASYFLEMNMLISLNGTLNQTGIGVGRVSLPSKGPMRGQYVFLMAKFQIFIGSVFS